MFFLGRSEQSAVLAVLNRFFIGFSLHAQLRKHKGNNRMVRHNNWRHGWAELLQRERIVRSRNLCLVLLQSINVGFRLTFSWNFQNAVLKVRELRL